MPTLILLFPLVLVIAAILTGRPGIFLVAIGLFVYVTWKHKTEGAARSSSAAATAGGAGEGLTVPQFAIVAGEPAPGGRNSSITVGCDCA